MSRAGYTEDCEDNWSQIMWRGRVASSIRGRRGQSFLRDLLASLDAMPEKRLLAHDIEVAPRDQPDPMLWWVFAEVEPDDPNARYWWYGHHGGFSPIPKACGVCTLGAAGISRGLDLTDVDPDDDSHHGYLAGQFDVAEPLVREIEYLNDECGAGSRWTSPSGRRVYLPETPEERWTRMRAWVAGHLSDGALPLSPAPRGRPMTDEQIKHMVDRFLGWKLPATFRPDAGISFDPEFNKEWNAKRGRPPQRHEPVGTNLFDADQATAMVRYMVEGLVSPAPRGEEGWVLVPREPTEEMVEAGTKALRAHIKTFKNYDPALGTRRFKVPAKTKAVVRYKAMLAAAPKAPGPTGEKG